MKPIQWSNKYSVCVIMASKGYPDKFKTGYVVHGLDKTEKDNLMVFHAGTKLNSSKIITDGGRVLGVTSLGNSIQQAIEKAYCNVKKISWGNNQQQSQDRHCKEQIKFKYIRFLC